MSSLRQQPTTSSTRMDAYTTAILSHPFRTRQGERRKTTASFLELLSAAFMECHTSENPLSYDIIRLHTSPSFQMISMGSHDCPFPESNSLEEHLANVSRLKRMNPVWTVGAFNFTAWMDEADDHAVVWFTSKGSGGPCEWNTNRESVSRLYWQKRQTDGVWECFRHICIRGPGNMFNQMDEFVPLPKVLKSTRASA